MQFGSLRIESSSSSQEHDPLIGLESFRGKFYKRFGHKPVISINALHLREYEYHEAFVWNSEIYVEFNTTLIVHWILHIRWR
jgi:hypothetical protein